MADSTSAAALAAPVPDPDAIARAERFTRERFVHAGETAADALAPGSARMAKTPRNRFMALRRLTRLMVALAPGASGP